MQMANSERIYIQNPEDPEDPEVLCLLFALSFLTRLRRLNLLNVVWHSDIVWLCAVVLPASFLWICCKVS